MSGPVIRMSNCLVMTIDKLNIYSHRNAYLSGITGVETSKGRFCADLPTASFRALYKTMVRCKSALFPKVSQNIPNFSAVRAVNP